MNHSLSHIFQKPQLVGNAGDIYPVLMKDYEEFITKSNIILYNYEHFDVDYISNFFDIPKDDIKLLDLIAIMFYQEKMYEQIIKNLEDVFSIVLRKKINSYFNEGVLYFYSDEGNIINRDNYDEIRKIIMEQNLLFEPKVFKNKHTQEWAELVLKQREKNSVKMTIEDMITTVAVFSGKHYWDLENYSYYQLKAEFNRISKIKEYETMSIALANPYASNIEIKHFAEDTEILKNPYDDIFVNKNKLSNLNSAIGG